MNRVCYQHFVAWFLRRMSVVVVLTIGVLPHIATALSPEVAVQTVLSQRA